MPAVTMHDTTTQSRPPQPAAPQHRVDRAELGLAVLLLGVGALVVYDASRITTTLVQDGPVGPQAVPYTVGGLLAVTALLLAVDVLRGGHGESQTGEDIDLEHGVDWMRLVLLVLVFLGTALAIPYAGFPIAGAALFWGAAVVLGSRRWLWDPVIAVVVAFGSHLVFTSSLGIALPAGVLQGVL
jgi:putative tricarboxylic transport membrane protein